jgi:outer membrane lipoprotein carrier protein
VVRDRDGKVVQEAKGSFVFLRPGRFRWTYAKPVDQVIVGDGERVWIYDRDLNQVTVRRLSKALGSTPAALLAGAADVEKAFELKEAGTREGLEWLEARPRESEAGFERIRMGFSAAGLEAMELTDNFGQTTRLRFSNLQRNPKVDPGEFRFEPPKGADVLGER